MRTVGCPISLSVVQVCSAANTRPVVVKFSEAAGCSILSCLSVVLEVECIIEAISDGSVTKLLKCVDRKTVSPILYEFNLVRLTNLTIDRSANVPDVLIVLTAFLSSTEFAKPIHYDDVFSKAYSEVKLSRRTLTISYLLRDGTSQKPRWHALILLYIVLYYHSSAANGLTSTVSVVISLSGDPYLVVFYQVSPSSSSR
jgi:hypothetical protein